MLKLGIDIGSTTVKTVILEDEKILYKKYERHSSKVRETVVSQLETIADIYQGETFSVCVTGSAGLGISESAGLPFVQEVHASFIAVKKFYPDTDVVIELGGEDAKIIFLTGGAEQRMNGSCAGGTGAFIDQMATLLDVSPDTLDEMALKSERTYPIASRCGVFAKSDIQPLLNQGAKREDVAASIFRAVVDQTVGGLAQGREIKGKVLFLGGPLSFLKGLRKSFVDTLNLPENRAVFPDNASVFVAIGCALCADENFDITILTDKIKNSAPTAEIVKGRRLFEDEDDYKAFVNRHKKNDVPYENLETYRGDAFLGVDAGSTTTKMVLITPVGKLLYQFYAPNKGQPLDRLVEKLKEIYAKASGGLVIRSSAVTGYGEDLIKAALKIDYGIVETVAHFKAASFFRPNVDFIIDIGGQDIKCFKIKNGNIDNIMLNEACSSGCGSFIQTFASALGYSIEDFAKLGLFARNPVDLGSRCTVFMNSSVKQAQKDGAGVDDISAGISASIIKNAVYKVIRARSPEDLGENIVVQGGTFLNDAVLRSFEQELDKNVTRPSISGLMGAFGAALYAKERYEKTSAPITSSLINLEELKNFSYTSKSARCGGCTANCELNVVKFANGTKYISGNKCERGAGRVEKNDVPNIFDKKYLKIRSLVKQNDGGSVSPEKAQKIAELERVFGVNQHTRYEKPTIGLPLVLEFYELMPFWHKFFTELGFRVIVSDESSRDIFVKGQSTIPSDTVCYPAKLTHGHILNLLEKGAEVIFYPCMTYNIDEGGGDNHYNCPVIAYYPELLKSNMTMLTDKNFKSPYIDLNRRKNAAETICKAFEDYGLNPSVVEITLEKALRELREYRANIIRDGIQIIKKARYNGQKIIVLAGRPYHVDPEINHGIQKIITSIGMAVITEDSVAQIAKSSKLNVINQWTYHSRLYRAAQFAASQPDMQLVQLVSFGCGIDAITSDETRSILENAGKIYTQIKIDEISNLGAAKIRLRSLYAAIS